jgi:hypothetical protein
MELLLHEEALVETITVLWSMVFPEEILSMRNMGHIDIPVIDRVERQRLWPQQGIAALLLLPLPTEMDEK